MAYLTPELGQWVIGTVQRKSRAALYPHSHAADSPTLSAMQEIGKRADMLSLAAFGSGHDLHSVDAKA
jgi:hypothetical protein